MCGFVVVLGDKARAELSATTEAELKELLYHRGPDAEGRFIAPGVYMYFRRLSIIDLSTSASQPMWSADDRYVMVYNGEIYNFRELAARYQLEDLRGSSDSEVLLELYTRLGARVVDVIRGMYAFVIYDQHTHQIFAARDTFGIKPLYYAEIPHGLIISSEIKPILKSIGRVSVNHAAAIRYLQRGFVDDGEETFFDQVRQVRPGFVLKWSDDILTLRRGRSLQLETMNGADELEYQAYYHDLLIDTVNRYLYADVPVGVSLSGGFDSSLLAYLVHAGSNGQQLHMFTRGYAGYAGNEFGAARKISEKFRLNYHEAVLAPVEVPDLIGPYSRIQEHPITSISILAFHKLYCLARETGVTVLLEGHGGDEIWAGYSYYTQTVSASVTSDLTAFSQDGSSLHLNTEILREQNAPAEIDFDASIGLQAASTSQLTQMQLRDMFGAKMQRNLRYVDRASMAAHVEARLPYLDVDVVEAALRIPDDWKIGTEGLRWFVRKMAAPYLGEAVAHRPKVPIQDPQRLWLQTEMRDYVQDILHSSNLFIAGLVDMDKLHGYFDDFVDNPERFPNLTFILYPVFLEEWHHAMQPCL